MNERLYIATHALQGLLAAGVDERGNPLRAPEDGASWAVQFADALLRELARTASAMPRPPPTPDPHEEGGDPWEREKAAAAAIEEDKPF